jgi:hypothetical protein
VIIPTPSTLSGSFYTGYGYPGIKVQRKRGKPIVFCG